MIMSQFVNKNDNKILSLSGKEIGFLISMIEEMAIAGKVLELAYTTKVKLQAKLNKIANNQMEF